MSHSHDRIKKHEAHTTIMTLRRSIRAGDVKHNDSQQIASYARFRKVLAFAEKALDSVDPELVTELALNQIDKVINRIVSHHEAFLQNRMQTF